MFGDVRMELYFIHRIGGQEAGLPSVIRGQMVALQARIGQAALSFQKGAQMEQAHISVNKTPRMNSLTALSMKRAPGKTC